MAGSVQSVLGGIGLSEEIAATADRLSESVVQVRVGHAGIGSGVIWQQTPARPETGGEPEALVVTNEHVVRASGSAHLSLLVHDGRVVPAEVIAHDPDHDLALLRTSASGLRAAEIGDSSALRVGELVIAVGNPFGKVNTLTAGIRAARAPADPDIPLEPAEPGSAPDDAEHGRPHRSPDGPRERASRTPDLIQADISLYPGNSGGPLADARGRVVGINSMVGGGLAFAIPSRIVAQFVAVSGSGDATQPYLGVEVLTVELTPSLRARAGLRAESAVLVAGVEPGSPAAEAGVLVGDLLIGLDGRALTTARDLLVGLRLRSASAPRSISIVRGGARSELTVNPASRPSAAAA